MRKLILIGINVLSLCSLIAAQEPAFSVASVKRMPVTPILPVSTSESVTTVTYSSISLAGLIRRAFELQSYQLVAPMLKDPLETYEVIAKLPPGSSTQQIPAMLRTLLADRFNLAVHREMRDADVYALEIDKEGLKLKALPPLGPDDKKPGLPQQQFSARTGHLHIAGRMTLAALTQTLDTASAMTTGRRVVDRTGVTGEFEIAIDAEFPPTGRSAINPVREDPLFAQPQADDAASIFSEIRKFGISLNPRRAPLEYIVVDRIDKTPKEN